MRLLELDGFRCTAEADVVGQRVPLEVERDGVVRVIGTQSGLLAANGASHSLDELFSLGQYGTTGMGESTPDRLAYLPVKFYRRVSDRGSRMAAAR
jgi:hypothetical protein